MIELLAFGIMVLIAISTIYANLFRGAVRERNQYADEAFRLQTIIRSLNQEIRDLKNPQPNLPELFSPETFAKYHNRRWHDGNRRAVDKALKWDDNAKGEA